MASIRLTKSALSAIKASTPCLSRARPISVVASTLCNSFASLYPPPNFNIIAKNCGGGISILSRSFHSSTPRCSVEVCYVQIDKSEFTDKAWEVFLGAADVAMDSEHDVLESEHLMKALLEQKDRSAKRILIKAGVDYTSVLQATEDFISKQPRVTLFMGCLGGYGSHFCSLVDMSRKHKQEMGDQLVSVEHLVLAFMSDKRFGQQLFNNLEISKQALQDAIKDVGRSERDTDSLTCH